jgi:hypothetical protein
MHPPIPFHWARLRTFPAALLASFLLLAAAPSAHAQLTDATTAVNTLDEGIHKSLTDQIGAGRGDARTPNSSSFIILRDPFRAIRRGRQLFQRKFTRLQGQGPGVGDGAGDLDNVAVIGAGLADSCAACHGRPRGSAGFGGDVATRPESRDAPHLFGLGLQEMLADEITADLRAIRDRAVETARSGGQPVRLPLTSPKGINYGAITALPNGTVDTSQVRGVNGDLRVRPFFAQGQTISIPEFVVGALKFEMGLDSDDPELKAASEGARFLTPSGMVLDGATDAIEIPGPDPSGITEIPTSLVDFFEFYLLNYFKPALYKPTKGTWAGREAFDRIGCASCHIPDLEIERDRRVADVETVYDPVNGVFNGLFATATGLFSSSRDASRFPPIKRPLRQPFLVQNIFSDFKRHDLGPAFHERNFNGTTQTEFMTEALWGVGSTAPYGHDGRSVNLSEVILRHGGEAEASRTKFAHLSDSERASILEFLQSLVLFPPDDTASNLNPADRSAVGFPQNGHGSIKLTVLFNDPTDVE